MSRPYFVGKPNPLMMRSALNAIDAHSESTVMVGDRMDTDVISGIEAGHADDPGADRLHPARTRSSPIPYRPTRVVDSIADVVPLVGELAPPEDEELSAD